MQLRFATEEEIGRWDELVVANPGGGHFQQSTEWAKFKSHYGWHARHVVAEGATGGEAPLALTMLEQYLPGLGRLWYAPKGLGTLGARQLGELADGLRELAEGVFLIKFDSELDKDDFGAKVAARHGIVPAPRNLQIKSTIVVDIAPSEDDIMATFKQKTRYNIRLADRKGVTVAPVEPTADNFALMHRLIGATHGRSEFFHPNKEYFERYWRELCESGHGQLFVASHDGQPLAGAFVTWLGMKAWYKDGGSVREHRELMAPYALQWGIMQWLKTKGIKSYDLLGSPSRSQLDGSHPLHSLYQFKSGFSSEIIDFVGTLDLPLNKRACWLWSHGVERGLVAINSRLKHTLWY